MGFLDSEWVLNINLACWNCRRDVWKNYRRSRSWVKRRAESPSILLQRSLIHTFCNCCSKVRLTRRPFNVSLRHTIQTYCAIPCKIDKQTNLGLFWLVHKHRCAAAYQRQNRLYCPRRNSCQLHGACSQLIYHIIWLCSSSRPYPEFGRDGTIR